MVEPFHPQRRGGEARRHAERKNHTCGSEATREEHQKTIAPSKDPPLMGPHLDRRIKAASEAAPSRLNLLNRSGEERMAPQL